MADLWKPGDVIVWRGIYRNRVWHAQTTILVKDSQEEIVLALLPGSECIAEESYPNGKKNARRRWFFVNADWKLAKYTWQTNRLLIILEPKKYYATALFWNYENSKFLCYYINFQLPFRRNRCSVDTLDLDLDLIINPDFTHEWKDINDYESAIEQGVMSREWVQGIEDAKPEIFDKLAKRSYPFDGSWLHWLPDPGWNPPTLPENWDKI